MKADAFTIKAGDVSKAHEVLDFASDNTNLEEAVDCPIVPLVGHTTSHMEDVAFPIRGVAIIRVSHRIFTWPLTTLTVSVPPPNKLKF